MSWVVVIVDPEDSRPKHHVEMVKGPFVTEAEANLWVAEVYEEYTGNPMLSIEEGWDAGYFVRELQ